MYNVYGHITKVKTFVKTRNGYKVTEAEGYVERLQSKRSTQKAPSLIPLPEALSLARSKSTPYWTNWQASLRDTSRKAAQVSSRFLALWKSKRLRSQPEKRRKVFPILSSQAKRWMLQQSLLAQPLRSSHSKGWKISFNRNAFEKGRSCGLAFALA